MNNKPTILQILSIAEESEYIGIKSPEGELLAHGIVKDALDGALDKEQLGCHVEKLGMDECTVKPYRIPVLTIAREDYKAEMWAL